MMVMTCLCIVLYGTLLYVHVFAYTVHICTYCTGVYICIYIHVQLQYTCMYFKVAPRRVAIHMMYMYTCTLDVYNFQHGTVHPSVRPSMHTYIDTTDPWINKCLGVYYTDHVYQHTQHTVLTRPIGSTACRDRARCLLQLLPVVSGPSSPGRYVKAFPVTW